MFFSNSVALLKTSKLVKVTSAIALFFVLLDMNTRLLKQNNYATISQKSITIETLNLPNVSAALSNEITEKYAKYRNVSPEADNELTKSADIMSLAEQALQNGELEKMYVGNKTLQLKAVISEDYRGTESSAKKNQRSAILFVEDKIENSQVMKKIKQGEIVLGFTLSIVDSTKVELSKLTNTSPQRIILSMYKTGA